MNREHTSPFRIADVVAILAPFGFVLSLGLQACAPSEPARSEGNVNASASAASTESVAAPPTVSSATTPPAPAVHYANSAEVKRFDDEVSIANEPAQTKHAVPLRTGAAPHDVGYIITHLPQAWDVVKIARVAAKPTAHGTSRATVLVSFQSKAQGGDSYLGWLEEESLVPAGSAQPPPAPPSCAAGQLSVLGKCVKQCFAPTDCAASEGCVPFALAGANPFDDVAAACAKTGSSGDRGSFFPKDGQCAAARSLVLDANGYVVCRKTCETDDECGKQKACGSKTKKPNRIDDVRVCAE